VAKVTTNYVRTLSFISKHSSSIITIQDAAFTTYMLDDKRLVISTGFVESSQHFVQMLRDVVFLIEQQHIEQLS